MTKMDPERQGAHFRLDFFNVVPPLMTDESELDRATHLFQWDFFRVPESLEKRQSKVGEGQTLQHSRDPQPGPGHCNTVKTTLHKASPVLRYPMIHNDECATQTRYRYNSLSC